MSYNAEEISREGGSPVEIIDIVLGTESWHHTTAEDPITVSAIVYTPLSITRDNIPVGRDENVQEVPLTVPGSHEFVRRFRLKVPKDIATVTIRRYHRYDGGNEVISLFKGYVTAVKYIQNGAMAQIGVAPFTINMGRPVPRYVYSGLCNHLLGDRWCTIDLDGQDANSLDLRFTGNLSNFLGNMVVVDGVSAIYPDNYFQGGTILTATGDIRLVIKQIGNNFYTYVPLFEGDDLEGTNVIVTSGCDHLMTTCKNKFDNVINYGGFPFVPRNNPFVTGLG